jgi:hypothetical protein
MFDIFVRSRSSIEEVKTDKLFSLISIIEPIDYRVATNDWQRIHTSFPAMAANKPNCVSSLCLRFYDTDQYINTDTGLMISPINDFQSKLIANFAVNCFEENIEELYVNCAAGISRSAGVAAAISKFYTGDDKYFYDKYIPNRYVYMRVLEALHELA